MPVPSYDAFIGPLLGYLSTKPDGAAVAEVYAALADAAGLTPEARAELLPSGAQPVFKNRIGWAHDRLKRAGLSASPRRGVWRLTPDGGKLAERHPVLPPAEVERLASLGRVHPRRREADASPSDAAPVGPENASPEERIHAAVAELRERVGRDLLENVGRSPPAFFERLVLDLLHAMGYGARRSDLRRVGGSGDGGIDGVISLDRLGLEKVYVQAKRWKGSVGSPEIQGFMGALQLQGASKGVFLTTSTFTREAHAAAAKARGSLVLVDGEQLAELMIDHGVGVSHEPLRVPKVDLDYFEEF